MSKLFSLDLEQDFAFSDVENFFNLLKKSMQSTNKISKEMSTKDPLLQTKRSWMDYNPRSNAAAAADVRYHFIFIV